MWQADLQFQQRSPLHSLEGHNGELVGFAKGTLYDHSDQPGFFGELNKIYLLREHQRRGLGRRLVGHVARRFLRTCVETSYPALRGPSLASERGRFIRSRTAEGGRGKQFLHRF